MTLNRVETTKDLTSSPPVVRLYSRSCSSKRDSINSNLSKGIALYPDKMTGSFFYFDELKLSFNPVELNDLVLLDSFFASFYS